MHNLVVLKFLKKDDASFSDAPSKRMSFSWRNMFSQLNDLSAVKKYCGFCSINISVEFLNFLANASGPYPKPNEKNTAASILLSSNAEMSFSLSEEGEYFEWK